MKYSALLAALLLSACGGGSSPDYVSEYIDASGDKIRCETELNTQAGTGRTVCREIPNSGSSGASASVNPQAIGSPQPLPPSTSTSNNPSSSTATSTTGSTSPGAPYVIDGVCYVPPGNIGGDKNDRNPDPCGMNNS